MSSSANKKDMISWINIIITIALMLFVGFLPPFGQITPVGMKVLGVFLGMMYGWITCGLIWPSLFGLVVFGFTGFSTVNAVFSSLFNTSVMQVFMCFVFAALLTCYGVTDYLAAKIMSIKFLIGRPWAIACALLLGGALISLLSSAVAATFIMWALLLNIADKVGAEKGDKFVAYIIAGIVYFTVFGGLILPFKVSALGFLGFVRGVIDITLPPVPFIIYTTSFVLIMCAAFLAIGKYVFKFDTSKFKVDSDLFGDLRGRKANKIEKIGLIFSAIFIGVLILPSFMPATWALTKAMNNLGLIGVIAVLATVGSFIKDENGNQIAPFKKLFGSIGWDMIWLLAATFPVANAMSSADTGIMATLRAFISPMIEGMSPDMLIIIFVVVLGCATQVVHNGVLGAMFMPFLCPIVAEMGGNPVTTWMCLYMILMCAFTTPAASMNAGLVFGHEYFKDNTMGYKFGSMILVMALVFVIASIPVMNMIF